MQKTSHFIGISMNTMLFSDIFIETYKYIKQNNILEAINIQNPISLHITLYYFEEDLSDYEMMEIKNDIALYDTSDDIFITGINYFFRNDNRYILYFNPHTNIPLYNYRNTLHKKYNRIDVDDNRLDFVPHITFLKICNSQVFEEHRENIENILKREIEKIKNLNICVKNLSLYAVNSNFREEIQIIL